jgi:hypothetical protein
MGLLVSLLYGNCLKMLTNFQDCGNCCQLRLRTLVPIRAGNFLGPNTKTEVPKANNGASQLLWCAAPCVAPI